MIFAISFMYIHVVWPISFILAELSNTKTSGRHGSKSLPRQGERGYPKIWTTSWVNSPMFPYDKKTIFFSYFTPRKRDLSQLHSNVINKCKYFVRSASKYLRWKLPASLYFTQWAINQRYFTDSWRFWKKRNVTEIRCFECLRELSGMGQSQNSKECTYLCSIVEYSTVR